MKLFTLKTLGLLAFTLIINSTANALTVSRHSGEIGYVVSTSVEFELIDNLNFNLAGYGKFSGVDNNSDGLLAFNELSTFIGYSHEGGNYDLSHLLDMGDFDVVNGKWLSNARSYRGKNDLWIKFDNGGVLEFGSRSWTIKTNSQSTSVSVPEPPMLVLLGTVFAGLAGFRRKRS